MSASDNMDLTFQDWEDYFEQGREEQKQISPPRTVDYGTGLSVVARWTMEQTRKADAALVEAAGCTCRSLYLSSRRSRHICSYDGDFRFDGDDFEVVRHDSRCPIALAQQIRTQA